MAYRSNPIDVAAIRRQMWRAIKQRHFARKHRITDKEFEQPNWQALFDTEPS